MQVVGKNFAIRGEAEPRPQVVLRPRAGGSAVALTIVKPEPYSILAQLPKDLRIGEYNLLVHNGKGGPAAWSDPLLVEIKEPLHWPEKIFNVRDFGAKGDDVTDDTQAIRDALADADKNGGGVVYFAWGTYRLTDWLLVPAPPPCAVRSATPRS